MSRRPMTSVLFLALIALLAVGLAASFAHYALDTADGSAPTLAKDPLSFVSYLQDYEHHAALIAYTPLGFDPTHSRAIPIPPSIPSELIFMCFEQGLMAWCSMDTT